jgi:hypothetical protein
MFKIFKDENGPARIVRSCTESLPRSTNFTIEDNCESWKHPERQICLCDKELCNISEVSKPSIALLLTTYLVVLNVSYF